MATISTEGYLGIGKESTYGTAVSVTKYIPILSESMAPDSGGIFPEDIRADRSRATALEGPFGVSGDVEFQAGPENGLGEMLLGALGTVTQGTTSPYTHTFVGASTIPSYTVEVNVGESMVRTIPGCKVGTLTISCAAAEPATITATLVGQTETIGTAFATAPTFSTLEPFKWSECKVTIDGTVDANIENLECVIENNLVTDLRTMNETRTIKELPVRQRIITGSMDLNFTSKTYYEWFLGGGTEPQISPRFCSLVFEFIPANTDYKLKITMSRVRLRTDSASISGTDRVVEGIEYDAIRDPSTEKDIEVELTNTESTY